MILNFALAAIVLGAQILLRFFKSRFIIHNSYFKYLFWLSIIVIFIVQSYWAREQFFVWHDAGPPASYFVPPYRGISYFLFYSLTHFYLKPFLALVAAVFVLFASRALNRRFQGRFFEEEEPYIAASALFLVGHPGWLYVLILVFAVSILNSIFHILYSKRRERIPMYWLWIPISIAVIIFTYVANSG